MCAREKDSQGHERSEVILACLTDATQRFCESTRGTRREEVVKGAKDSLGWDKLLRRRLLSS